MDSGRRMTRRETIKLALGPTQLEKRLREAFNVFDNAGNGEVDVRDLGTIIRSLGCVISEAELQEVQVELENVENSCVPLNRFLEYMTQAISDRKFKPAEPEELLKAFQLLDSENRGYLIKEDFGKALMEIGEPFTEEEVANMMVIACDPQTKRINYEQYINKLIVKVPEDRNVYSVAEKIEAINTAMSKRRRLDSKFFLFRENED